MKCLVSACLCGMKCRYDGKVIEIPKFRQMMEEGVAIAVCPEVMGGRPVPRVSCEIKDGRVMDKNGMDCTDDFEYGAQLVLEIAKKEGCSLAILKEKSPSCGSSFIYDGSFSGVRIPGEGVTTKLLRSHGIEVISEEEFLNK